MNRKWVWKMRLHRYAELLIVLNVPWTSWWPDFMKLWKKFKGLRETPARCVTVTLSLPAGYTQKRHVRQTPKRSNNAPSNLKFKVWKRFGFHEENVTLDKKQTVYKLCRTAFKYRGSVHLSIYVVRQHGETCADDENASKEHARQRHGD